MTPTQERIYAFWAGERPDQIPFTTYPNKLPLNDPAVQAFFEDGLGVTQWIPSWTVRYRDIEIVDDRYSDNGRPMRRQEWRTPVGTVYATWEQDWHQKYFIETAEDYRIMTYIVEHTDLEPDYDTYLERETALPGYAVAIPRMGRTPLQTMLVDYAGLQNFSYHLYEYEEEVAALYDALLKQFRRHIDIVAGGPGRYTVVLENFTAESLGPRRYKQYLLPVYEECFPVLHQAGKIVGVHYDGQTKSCADLIAGAPIDLLETLTPPPEGDQTLAEARAVWPDKLFWSHLNLGCYELPPDELERVVLERVAEGAPDGRRLAFEISEDEPPNWRSAIPVILNALKQTRV